MARNSRFLVFPWVRVKNLASRSLALAARRLADDWEERWGARPVLAETFVDPEKFEASCYRAENWEMIGRSSGSGSKTPKDVYALPLAPGWRAILKGERKPPKRMRTRDLPPERNPATGCRPSTEIAPGAAETSKKADKKSPNRPNARIPN